MLFRSLLSLVIPRTREVKQLTHRLHNTWFQLHPVNDSFVRSVWNKRGDTTHLKGTLFTMKLDTPQFRALFTPELVKLTELFKTYGYELRIAGGAVRDLLSLKLPDDIDFATTATPDQMKTMFEKEEIRMFNTKGETHGTVTCRINDKENFEVTTLRIDVATDGRHAQVEFTTDWELDALRRDLTINSMFLGFDGTLYDYFSGKEDLEQKKVRFVGDAEARITEDYLRILRYFRFYGRISQEANNHEAQTLDAIRENVSGLQGISGERIWSELKKIVLGNHAGPVLKTMIDVGMAPFMGLPTKVNPDEFDRIWNLCHDLEPQSMTLIAALLASEEEVYQLHGRLKLSKEELRTGLFTIAHRGDDLGSNPLRQCQDLYTDTAGKEPKTKEKICELLKYLNKRELLKTFSEWEPPRFPVTGYNLIQMGVGKGPLFAKILNGLRQKWKESGYTASLDELLSHVEEMKKTIK